MASQRDGDVAAPVDGAVGVESLPTLLLLHILALVPVDTRLRCREVSRVWRDALADRRVWTRLDLSEAAGVQPERITYKLVEAAVARAGGALEALNLSSCRRTFRSFVQRLAAGNAGTLRELWLFQERNERLLEPFLSDLLQAAPALREVHVSPVFFYHGRFPVDEARTLLGGEPRFSALRWQRMRVNTTYRTGSRRLPSVEDWLALFDAVAAHAWLCDLDTFLPPPHALRALVDAAMNLTRLRLYNCRPTTGAGMQLARLLRGGKLKTLEIQEEVLELEDLSGAEAFALAVGECSSLQRLDLHRTRVWSVAEVGVPLLRALTGHPTLRSFSTLLAVNDPYETPDAGLGAAFGALVAANAPALLEVSFLVNCVDDLLRPLIEALPVNAHLRTLELGRSRLFTSASLSEELLTAVRANRSLRSFRASMWISCLSETDALMAARRAADAAAARGNVLL